MLLACIKEVPSGNDEEGGGGVAAVFGGPVTNTSANKSPRIPFFCLHSCDVLQSVLRDEQAVREVY